MLATSMTVISDAPRKVKDPERTRSDILKAALLEFAAHGFEAATVRGIATRIGMSHGMIRYHYETKEQLWFAAADFLFERMGFEMALSDDEQTRLMNGDLTVWENWLRRYVHYCAKHPEHARFMVQESVAPSERLNIVIERHIKPGHTQGLKFIDLLKDFGVFDRNLSSISILYIIVGACKNIFTLAPEVKQSVDYDVLSHEAIEAHADAIIRFLSPRT